MWKDFFAVHPAAKFTLIPPYIYSAWALRGSLRGGPQSILWQLLGALCAVATLVPAWLVEFRCEQELTTSTEEYLTYKQGGQSHFLKEGVLSWKLQTLGSWCNACK